MSVAARTAARTAPPTGEDRPRTDRQGPIKVLVIDVERLPGHVSAARPDGSSYRALWALVRRNGRPTALLKLPFEDEGLSAEQLSRHVGHPLEGSPNGHGVAGNGVAEHGPAAFERSPPGISVIVPTTFKRLDDLFLTLDSLERLEYPAYEVLLVDNRVDGDEEVPTWVERFPAVRILAERRPGISAARNRGLAVATGEIVAFTDDDVTVDPGWLRAIAERFANHPEEACVTGLVLPRELETPAQVQLEEYYGGFGPRLLQPVSHRLRERPGGILPRGAWVQELDAAGRSLRTFSLYAAGTFGMGANMAFRAETLRDVGGFDETLGVGTPARGGEDLSMFVQLAWRGHSLGFEPSVLVHHTHRRDDPALRSQLEAYGVGFTAMLSALVMQDRGHLGAMLATLPRAVRSLGASYRQKLRPRSAERKTANQEPGDRATEGRATEGRGEIAGLARLELRGMVHGPLAYRQSRRLLRSLPRDPPS